MAKVCDNMSVGMRITYRGRLAMIDRGNYPKCKALPAGHLDGGTYPVMAVTETREEIGLEILMRDLQMIFEGPIVNPCKREGGSYHDWRVYTVPEDSLPESLGLKAGDDAKQAFWAEESQWRHFAIRTEYFISKLDLLWTEVGTLTLKIFGDPKTGPVTVGERMLCDEWDKDPGLEPCWYYLLRMCEFFDWTFQNAPVKRSTEIPEGT